VLNNAKNRAYIGYNFAKKVVPLQRNSKESHVIGQRPSSNVPTFFSVAADKNQPSFLRDYL
jgi:hypothetical protein